MTIFIILVTEGKKKNEDGGKIKSLGIFSRILANLTKGIESNMGKLEKQALQAFFTGLAEDLTFRQWGR